MSFTVGDYSAKFALIDNPITVEFTKIEGANICDVLISDGEMSFGFSVNRRELLDFMTAFGNVAQMMDHASRN